MWQKVEEREVEETELNGKGSGRQRMGEGTRRELEGGGEENERGNGKGERR